jgi:hypothetical protein
LIVNYFVQTTSSGYLNVCCIPETIRKKQVVILSRGETVKQHHAEDLSYQEPVAYATAAATGESKEIGRNCWE